VVKIAQRGASQLTLFARRYEDDKMNIICACSTHWRD